MAQKRSADSVRAFRCANHCLHSGCFVLVLKIVCRVAAQDLRQVLTESRAWDDHIAASFGGFQLQVSLQVRKEPNEVGVLLQLGLELRNERQRLRAVAVQIENDEGRLLFECQNAVDHFFLALHKIDFYVEFAGRFLNLRQEEEVIDEAIDRLIAVRAYRFGGLLLIPSALATSVSVVVLHVLAVTVIHGSGVDSGVRSAGIRWSAILTLAALEFATTATGTAILLAAVLLARMSARSTLGMSALRRATLLLCTLCVRSLRLALGLRSSAMTTTPATPTASAPSSIVAGGLVRSTIHMFGFSIYHFRNFVPVGRLRVIRISAFRTVSVGTTGGSSFSFFPDLRGVHGSDVAFAHRLGITFNQPWTRIWHLICA